MRKIITWVLLISLVAFSAIAEESGSLSSFNQDDVVAGFEKANTIGKFELVNVYTDTDAETILYKAKINQTINLDGIGFVSYNTNVTPASGASITNFSYSVNDGSTVPSSFVQVILTDYNLSNANKIAEAEGNISSITVGNGDYIWVKIEFSDLESAENTLTNYEYNGSFGTAYGLTATNSFELGLREVSDSSGGVATGCCQFRDACYGGLNMVDCQLKMHEGGDHYNNPQLYVEWYVDRDCSTIPSCDDVCCETGDCTYTGSLRLFCVIDLDGTPISTGSFCNDGNSCTTDETCQASGTCSEGTQLDCGDDDECTSVSCDGGSCSNPGLGCTNTDLGCIPEISKITIGALGVVVVAIALLIVLRKK